jgi:SAM-dependent methyltransferase
MIGKLVNRYLHLQKQKAEHQKNALRAEYLQKGQIPWAPGYWEYRNEKILEAISNQEVMNCFIQNKVPESFGLKLDERIVEYAWIFSRMPEGNIKMLDAGSTFNFDFIVNHPKIAEKELTILTYSPEKNNFHEKRISYQYADLRDIPFRDECFDLIVSQSTIEHIDMDNSIYGYDIEHHLENINKSYDYLNAVKEMLRVLKKGGQLMITFPFGKFENHGFFQQFDDEMLEKILELLKKEGETKTTFYRYTKIGWIHCSQADCKDIVSFNPHTGQGKGEDGAAHCRAVACLHLSKK